MFVDVKPDAWDYNDINDVARAGVMTGYPDGTFKPDQPVTRGELAAVVNRLLHRDSVFRYVLPQVMPSVVCVYLGDQLGSGTCIKNDGSKCYILTNAHVIHDHQTNKDVSEVTLIKEGNIPQFTGQVVHVDSDIDLALITTTYMLKDLPLGKEPVLGQRVAVIGAPLGHIESVTVGVVSQLNQNEGRWLQVDAPINPGNSGGTLANQDGQLIGVPCAKIEAVGVEGMGFCIHIDYVRKFLADAGLQI